MNGRSITGPLVKFLVFVLVTVLATGILVLTIANNDLRSAETYTARFTDVTALNEGDEVRIAGVKVGEVQDIAVVDRRVAEVRFTVTDRRLPESVTATVKYRNLVGQRYISLEQGAGSPGRYLPAGGTIPLERTRPALDLTVLLGGFKPLFQALSPQDVNKLSFEIIQVLQGEGGTVESLLAHTASLTSTIASKDQVIGEVINNLNGTLETVNARDEQLSGLIVQLQQVVSGLAADRDSIGDAVTAMDGLTNTTAGLLSEARPGLQQDIASLGDLSKNLNDHEQLTDHWLKNMPGKLETIGRTATHGSWFNFYMCQAQGTVGVGDLNLPLPLQPVTQPRCQR
ncbi:phospholipid/cholesterol/gamma-HCH transport system substrate-binding protein [Saccharopolyspora erythraea NRRL 2338]|uniref:Mce family protein n=2 Tax=Saccharopolyspora erythraea TaxID=1836 RepID=A4FPQ1_SACEN|nr:MCE family protein [Saccharopolyspora erythraea]EQD86911.1 ABC transporter substrate-binding protein [Saccharopolyspora erythraea D]PFG99671.1 phospholipid/cholesterol/gamma-HCH transport system substrate-binding protein [Saccharopolyspora erythraea NRRL 2338]QRK89557.1 MCE family protein [Saccharopolyspora erythraea]CAM06026.1 putative Mce family protein [Saccharopolyspora erythraea NRRL 2338]